MKVILQKDLKGSGKAGDVVEVSDGYANNYLLKRGIAVLADAKNLNKLAGQKQAKQFQDEQQRQEAKQMADLLEGKTIQFETKAAANGRLFGSITTKDVAHKVFEELGITIDKKKITLNLDIKEFGCYTALVKIKSGVEAEFKVMVTEKS